MRALLMRCLRSAARLTIAMVFVAAGTLAVHAEDSVLDRSVDFDIPAQQLTSALFALSKQAGIQVVTSPEVVGNISISGIHGNMKIRDALSLLLHGTKLGFHQGGANTIGIDAPQSRIDADPAIPVTGEVSDAQAGTTPITDQAAAAEKPSNKLTRNLETVLVTGSRIPRTAKEGAQEVKVFTKEQIEQSGQTTISDFLNTLPDVSVNTTEAGFQTNDAATTVQLHGMPQGTTLVLLNGRRIEVSAVESSSGFNFFDLNNLPVAAVERIEVVSEGSSAVYGSDAIAGVVNIVLRRDFNGLEANAKYGWASGTQERAGNLAWGKQWDSGYVSAIASYQTRSALLGAERGITSNTELFPLCPLAEIYSIDGSNLPGTNSPYASVSPNSTAQHYAANPGALPQCSQGAYQSTIPQTRRQGLLMEGGYDITPSISVFAELLYSHVLQDQSGPPPYIVGIPGFTPFTVSASNPYNPYGETVGVGQLLTSAPAAGQATGTVYFRPLIGARGKLPGAWDWEVATWLSADRTSYAAPNDENAPAIQAALNSTDPATALNPFIAGPPGSPQQIQSLFTSDMDSYSGQTRAVNGFVRGPLYTLPSGPVSVVIGSEYSRDTLNANNINDPFSTPGDATYHRDSYAVFGEARIPILANHENPQAGDTLAATIAGRYDSYDDFGHKLTPQYGAEWRPSDTLLIRATYGKAFKAPSLFQLYAPESTVAQFVTDPLLGGQTEAVNTLNGGNPRLKPETGQSRTFGLVYSSVAMPGLQLSITHWGIDESNNIQNLDLQTIIDNPGIFPNNVTRASSCASGPPCPITLVDDTSVNFGDISVAGFDYQINYRYKSSFGQLTPSLNVTQTYHYSAALTPDAPPLDATSKAQDSGNWAPRWKGTVALGWKLGPYTGSVDGRYVGHYQDYDATSQIGNFWIYDASFRYAIGSVVAANIPWLKGTFLSLGGVNLFNRLPQNSNFNGGIAGYDPAQGDIRGRFLYAQLGVKY